MNKGFNFRQLLGYGFKNWTKEFCIDIANHRASMFMNNAKYVNAAKYILKEKFNVVII